VSKHHSIIVAPLITERNTLLRAEQNKYAFEVVKIAKKTEIKKAVEAIFGVTVEKVNTMIVKGKRKRMNRFVGYQSDKKKAIVTLKEGQKIDKFGEV
jgi:large subunit ribosomal protein L23